MNIYLETFGCQMNRLDSELVAGLLLDSGHQITADREAADVVLYNTCSVRAHAENKVYSRLGEDSLRRGAAGRPIIILPREELASVGLLKRREAGRILFRSRLTMVGMTQ